MSPSHRLRQVFVPLLLPILVATLACGQSTPEVSTQPPAGTEQPISPSGQQPTEPPPTPTEASLGSSRSNPAPAGSEVKIDDYVVVVTEVISPADDIVRRGNMFNTTPEPGNHYVFVNTTVTCTLPSDQSCNLSTFEFTLIDASGIAHDPGIFLTGVTGLLEDGEFFGGATKSGYLAFIVPDDDAGLILHYEALLFGGEAFMAIQ